MNQVCASFRNPDVMPDSACQGRINAGNSLAVGPVANRTPLLKGLGRLRAGGSRRKKEEQTGKKDPPRARHLTPTISAVEQ